MAELEWKSPRAVAVEIRGYKHSRFEEYMLMVERGELVLEVACMALREEMNYVDMEEASGSAG